MTLLDITKALADESRLRILNALGPGELCVCQIVELMDLAPSTTSKHLAQLRSAGLIDSRKRGRWIYYRLVTEDPGEVPDPQVVAALHWVSDAMSGEGRWSRDRERLEEVVSEDPVAIAMRQRECSNNKCGGEG